VYPFPTIKVQPKTATTFTVQYKHGVRALERTFTMDSMAKDANFTTLQLNPRSTELLSDMEANGACRGFNYSKKRLQVLLNLGESKTGARELQDKDAPTKTKKAREDDLQKTGNVYEVRVYDKKKLDQTEVQGNLVTVNKDSDITDRAERSKITKRKSARWWATCSGTLWRPTVDFQPNSWPYSFNAACCACISPGQPQNTKRKQAVLPSQ
jgi:hypothetical protein